MSDNPAFILRPAQPNDVPTLFSLIKALAEYEKLTDQVTGSEALLHEHLFGDRPYIEAVLAEPVGAEAAESAGPPIGFALFFTNYSTFLTKPGIYLEDLFVMPGYRSQGVGKALLAYLAQLAIARDCGRLEWSVLDWNQSAIGFYERMGATVLPDWRICRVTGAAIAALAEP